MDKQRDPIEHITGTPDRAGGFSPFWFFLVQAFIVVLIIVVAIVVAVIGVLAGPGN